MKADLYTKTVLTVIAVALVGILIKDVDFVSSAQAKSTAIDLSALTVEKAASDDEKEMTFFIYENSKIKKPFSKEGSYDYDGPCEISNKDIPTYIITNVKPKNSYPYYTEIKKTKK